MRSGDFDWDESPIDVVSHEGAMYVVDGHHRLAAAKLAGVSEVRTRDVTEELNSNGFLGYSDMEDVLDSASRFTGNRLNRYKLR